MNRFVAASELPAVFALATTYDFAWATKATAHKSSDGSRIIVGFLGSYVALRPSQRVLVAGGL